MKSILMVLFIICMVFVLGAGDIDLNRTKYYKITHFGSQNGRVTGQLERPNIGDDIYNGHVDFEEINDPLLFLSNLNQDRDLVVEINAVNVIEPGIRHFMVRVLPGQAYLLDLEPLGQQYRTLTFMSHGPFLADIKSRDGNKSIIVSYDHFIYNPPEQKQFTSLAPKPDKFEQMGGETDDGILLCEGEFTLSCYRGFEDLCGSFSITAYGELYEYESQWGTCYNLYWNLHYPYGCTTINRAFTTNGTCWATWDIRDGCPYWTRNCLGEAYYVNVASPL